MDAAPGTADNPIAISGNIHSIVLRPFQPLFFFAAVESRRNLSRSLSLSTSGGFPSLRLFFSTNKEHVVALVKSYYELKRGLKRVKRMPRLSL